MNSAASGAWLQIAAGSGWIHETTMTDWQFVLGVNLTGPFLCAKHSLPHMMTGGGSFVVTSSIAGSVVGAGGAAAYTVSKHGVLGLVKQIAVDYGQHGIRANAIQPAAVQGTRLAAHAAEDRAKATTHASATTAPKPGCQFIEQASLWKSMARPLLSCCPTMRDI